MTFRSLVVATSLLALLASSASGREPLPQSTREKGPSTAEHDPEELMESVRQDLNIAIQSHESSPVLLPTMKVESANVSEANHSQKPAQEVTPRDAFLGIQNSEIEAWKDYFSGRGSERIQAALLRLGPHREHLEGVLKAGGLPPEMLAVAFVESDFFSAAISPQAATGLWQFMPVTALRYGLELKPFQDDRTNLEKSTFAAARYLTDLHERFGDWLLALAAYNAGEGQVDSAISSGKTRDFWALSQFGLLPQETRDYVPKVVAALHVWREIEARNPETGSARTGEATASGHENWVYTITSGD